MVLLFHIAVAFVSIAYATYLYIAPAKAKFSISYSLVTLTLASGTYLAILNPSHVAQATLSGLIYISIVFFAIVSARRKFSRREEAVKERI